jgi:hypothetical protein
MLTVALKRAAMRQRMCEMDYVRLMQARIRQTELIAAARAARTPALRLAATTCRECVTA